MDIRRDRRQLQLEKAIRSRLRGRDLLEHQALLNNTKGVNTIVSGS